MGTTNLNQVAITGNLTRDPKLRRLPSGHTIVELQIASHRRSRDEATGEWKEWPDYFTAKAFGHQARTTHRHLRKGHGVAIAGRLSSRRTTGPNGEPKHATEIIAETVQFLARPKGQ